jgi:hypothetical protein
MDEYGRLYHRATLSMYCNHLGAASFGIMQKVILSFAPSTIVSSKYVAFGTQCQATRDLTMVHYGVMAEDC